MTGQDLVQFWQTGSDEAWQTVQALVQTKRYLHALFFCHLTLEKLLKARYVESNQKPPPPTHDLTWLADEAGVTLTPDNRNHLAEISRFNIAGRYEEYRNKLHQRATAEFTLAWVEKTALLREQLQQKI